MRAAPFAVSTQTAQRKVRLLAGLNRRATLLSGSVHDDQTKIAIVQTIESYSNMLRRELAVAVGEASHRNLGPSSHDKPEQYDFQLDPLLDPALQALLELDAAVHATPAVMQAIQPYARTFMNGIDATVRTWSRLLHYADGSQHDDDRLKTRVVSCARDDSAESEDEMVWVFHLPYSAGPEVPIMATWTLRQGWLIRKLRWPSEVTNKQLSSVQECLEHIDQTMKRDQRYPPWAARNEVRCSPYELEHLLRLQEPDIADDAFTEAVLVLRGSALPFTPVQRAQHHIKAYLCSPRRRAYRDDEEDEIDLLEERLRRELLQPAPYPAAVYSALAELAGAHAAFTANRHYRHAH